MLSVGFQEVQVFFIVLFTFICLDNGLCSQAKRILQDLAGILTINV